MRRLIPKIIFLIFKQKVVCLFFLIAVSIFSFLSPKLVSAEAGKVCSNDTDCQADEICAGVCTKKSRDGTPCRENKSCQSDKCENGYCAPAPAAPAAAEEKYVPPIEPKLQINIPGFTGFSKITPVSLEGGQFVYIPYIAEYIAALFKFLVAIAGILSGIMITYAGVKWMLAAGDSQKISEAKKKIGNAVIGLILVVSAYTILYLINPDLVTFKSIRIAMIPKELYEPGQEATEISQSKGLECFLNEFGSTEAAVKGKLVTVTIATKTSGSATFQVNEKMASALKAVGERIKNSDYKMISGGAFNWRRNVNNPATLSLHSFGIALDINVAKNPNYAKAGQGETCKTDIPDDIISAFESSGFKWGGKFRYFCDAMHFEWRGPCGK